MKKSEAELDRYNELKAKKCLLEEKLFRKLEQLYDLCQQEAVSTRFAIFVVANSCLMGHFNLVSWSAN